MLISEISNDRQSFKLSHEFFYDGSNSRDVLPKNREFLKLIVDEPCLAACEYLYDCNIRTVNSSANVSDVGFGGYITIDYTTLDNVNKKVCEELSKNGIILDLETGSKEFNIRVPITDTTTCEQFSKKMLEIAMMFQKQDILYGRYTEEEMNDEAISSLKKNDTSINYGMGYWDIILNKINEGEIPIIENGEIELVSGGTISISLITNFIASDLGYYFDEVNRCWWIDKELFDKHIEYENSLNKLKR